MGRPLRHLEPGAVYHVVARGNNRAPIVVDDEDRRFFVRLLRRVAQRYQCSCT
jgi:REP element-mobilizing transposase RayT